MDRGLVVRAQHGDHVAFSELAATSIRRLTAVARLVLHDESASEDAVQDALVTAWRSLPTLRDPDRFEAWLRRILMRACFHHAGRRHRQGVHELVLGSIDGPATADDQDTLAIRDQLERGLRGLSAEQRAALVLTYYLDLPVAEAAHALDIPVGTMKSRLHRAQQALRAELDAEERAASPAQELFA